MTVVAPAIGGILPGVFVSQHLKSKLIILEKGFEGFVPRQGSVWALGERAVIVDDVVNTGTAMRDAAVACHRFGLDVITSVCVLHKSRGDVDIGQPLISAARCRLPEYEEEGVPDDLKALPVECPSRCSQLQVYRDPCTLDDLIAAGILMS